MNPVIEKTTLGALTVSAALAWCPSGLESISEPDGGAHDRHLDNQASVDVYLAARKEQWMELERQGTPPNAELLARLENARGQAIIPHSSR